LRGIDFEAHAGEVVGLGGLDGQGQREFFLALFGVLAGVQGEVAIEGRPGLPRSPREAKGPRFGLALAPEDRKTDGLMLPMSVRDNLSFAALSRLFPLGVITGGAEDAACAAQVQQLAIKAPALGDAVGTLSGGNQQKVVIGKWLMTGPRTVLLSDPTRGIDVGTKQEIYALLRRLADGGACVVLYSTDYAELIGCCDRVAVFREGRIAAWLQGEALTEHALIASALGVAEGQEAMA
jgi:ribose transport system ATP-binding protein